jgi:parallel beta-helix repeat protein
MGKTAALLLVLILAASCRAAPLSVKAGSRAISVPNDYPTIGSAIGNASAGDTVYVKSGIYHECLQINTSLSLIGENRDTTVIEGVNDSESVVTVTHDSVTIAGFTIRKALGLTASGIELFPGLEYCNISGNRITGNTNGIHLISASNNNITGNIIDSNSAVGIALDGASYPSTLCSNYNNIQRNEILSNGGEGIVLRLTCSYNNITGNNIGKSMHEGILLSWASYNRINENSLTNSGVGVGDAGSGNTFHHNNFINNTQQAYASWLDEATGQVVFSAGNWTENYWSDYTGKDNNGDGRGDTPYIIDQKSQDKAPLMAPFGPYTVLPEFQSPSTSVTPPHSPSPSPTVSVVSPENTSYVAIYNPYITIPLIFKTNETLSWIGYSLDGGNNITVSKNGTMIEIPKDSKSLTLYANDTAGNWVAPQTVYYEIAFNLGYPPTQPFPTLLIVAISVAVVAVVGVGLLVYFKKRKHKA